MGASCPSRPSPSPRTVPTVVASAAPVEALTDVPEADQALHDAARAPVERRQGQPLEMVLGVRVRPGAERGLELRQARRPAGLAHVVVPAAGLARVLDCEAVEQVV